MNRLYTYFVQNNYHQTVWLFRRCMYAFLLLQLLVLLPEAEYFFSPKAYMLSLQAPDNIVGKLLTLLSHPSFSDYYWVFIAGDLLFLFLGLMGVLPGLSAVGVYFFTFNLFRKGIEIQNGGWHLVALLLFFNLFFIEKERSKGNTNWLQSVRVVVANASLFSARIQIAILYLVAGFYKLTGELWLKGEAVLYVLQTDAYSHPWLQSDVFLNVGIVKFATWFALVYQLLFPVLVWFRVLKKPLLLAGVLFHLFIAFGMGLMDFGIIMIVSYTLFFSEHEATKFIEKFHFFYRLLPTKKPEPVS